MPQPLTGKQLHQLYFDAYAARGAEISVWEQLGEAEQAVWEVMASQVALLDAGEAPSA